MELVIDTALDDLDLTWRTDISAEIHTLLPFHPDGLQVKIPQLYVELPDDTLLGSGEVEVEDVLDEILDMEWHVDERMYEVAEDGTVTLGKEMRVLEEIACVVREEAVDVPVLRRMELPLIEELVLPASATGTSYKERFKPMPTIQKLAARSPRLTIAEGPAIGWKSVVEHDPFIVRSEVLSVLIGVVGDLEDDDGWRWVKDAMVEMGKKRARWTEAVETPIFASRNDPDTIPRPCFSSKHLNTPPPQHSLTGDGPFNALVTGIRQVDPLMRIDDDDEGAAEHVVPSEMMEFLATPFWPPDELRNVSAILEECDDATVQTTLEPGINTNRKRVLEELEPPIFSSVDDMMVGAKRQKHEHLSVLDAVHLAAPHIPADVAHQDMSENALDKEADLELERFFDFHAAALHNPLAGILDANWDMASSRTLPVPILPYPRPFHRTPDPWPSFPALLTTTLDVRSFNPVVSTEMSLGLFWNPVAALLRTGLANNAATADSGRSVVREILGKPFWGVDMQSKVIEVEGDHKFRVEDYVGSKKCEIGYDDEAPITPIRTLIPKRPTRSRKPALENIPHCQNRAASPAPLTKVQNPNEDVIAIDVEDETASDGNDHELQGRTEHVAATPAQMDDDEAFGYDTQTALEMLALEEDPFVVEDGDYEPRVIDVDELEFGSDKVDAAQEGIVEDAGAEAQVDMDGPEYGLGVVNKPFSVRASLDQFLRLRGKENMLDPVDPVAPPRPPRVLMERDEAPNSPQPATPTPLTTAYQQHQPRAFELPPFDRAAASRHTYIASQRVLNRRDLVRALEHDFNVDLIERDLDHRPGLGDEDPVDADLILDERTAVIFYPLSHLPLLVASLPTTTPSLSGTRPHLLALLEALRKQPLIALLVRCILKYATIRLVLETPAGTSMMAYPFTPPVVKALTFLSAFAAACRPWADVGWGVARSVWEAAWMARTLCDQIGDSYDTPLPTHPRAPQPWSSRAAYETRTWLHPLESTQERFLRSLPPLNSYSAQLVLTITPDLRTLCEMNQEEMARHAGTWIGGWRLRVLQTVLHARLGPR